MQKSNEDNISSFKAGAKSMFLFILSMPCFIVLLWLIAVVVRLVAGIGAA